MPHRSAPNRLLLIVLETGRMTCSCRCLYWIVCHLAATHHHPQLQSCYAGSSLSSWPIPVRETHHGKDARYYALYTGRRGASVRPRKLVMELQVSRVAAYIRNEVVVPIRMSYASQVHDRISVCQTRAQSHQQPASFSFVLGSN